MNGISVHCAISIFRRYTSYNYRRVVNILVQNGAGKLGSGWQRAFDNPQLFLTMYQFIDESQLTLDRDIELSVWKMAFPDYPKLFNWENNVKIYEAVIKRELHIQHVLDKLSDDMPELSGTKFWKVTTLNGVLDLKYSSIERIIFTGSKQHTVNLPDPNVSYKKIFNISNRSTRTVFVNSGAEESIIVSPGMTINFVCTNGKWNFDVDKRKNYCNPIYRAMREFKNPKLKYSEVEEFLQTATQLDMDLPRLIDDLIMIRNWPENTDIDKVNFWRIIFEKLSNYKQRAFNAERIRNLYDFIEKYSGQVDWQKDDVYKLINYEFLETHQDMWSFMNWQKIIQHIKLPEAILDSMMERSTSKQQFFRKNLNIAHLPTFQTLTEEFIEKWFVNTTWDQDHIWANIFRSQRHLSAEFRRKYSHKQGKGLTSYIHNTIADMREKEERRTSDAPTISFGQLTSMAKKDGSK